jgi:hypothetical protein
MEYELVHVPIKPQGNTVFYVGVRWRLNGKVFLVAESESVTLHAQSVIVDLDHVKPTPANVSSILFRYYPNFEGKGLRHPTDEEAKEFVASGKEKKRLVFGAGKTIDEAGQIGEWRASSALSNKPNSAFMFSYFREDFSQLFVEC